MQTKFRKIVMLQSLAGLITIGMSLLALGALVPNFIEEFSMSYSQSGTLMSVSAWGLLISMLFSGILSEKIGLKKVNFIAAALMFISYILLMTMNSQWLLYPVFFISGFSAGIINFTVNVIVTRESDGSGSTLSIIHSSYCVGALIFPLVVGLLIQSGMSWRLSVIPILVMNLIFFIFSLFQPVDLDMGSNIKSKNEIEKYKFYKDITFYLFTFLMFFYVGFEHSINNWLSTHLIASGAVDASNSRFVVSVMWGIMLIGRLILAAAARKFSKKTLLLICSVSIGFAFLFLMTAKTVVIIWIAAALLGFSLSGVYPLTIANASSVVKKSEKASGFMLSLGGLGSAILPLLAGMIAQAKGINSGMWSLFIFVVPLMLLAVYNSIRKQKQPVEQV